MGASTGRAKIPRVTGYALTYTGAAPTRTAAVMTMNCSCGEGCEEFSCFVGFNCQCCIETYGKRRICECNDCRRALFEELRSAPGDAGPVDAREAD